MTLPLNIRAEDRAVLENEFVSPAAKLSIVKILDRGIERRENPYDIDTQARNRLINKARTFSGDLPYVLEPDDMGTYELFEMTWHEGELRAAFLRLGPVEFFDLVADLVNTHDLTAPEVDEVFSYYSISAALHTEDRGSRPNQYWMVPKSEFEVDDEEQTEVHASVRQLYDRAVRSLEQDDFGGALHAAASITESIAKTVVKNPNVLNQPLGGWFAQYRNISNLPAYVLDAIQILYDQRNTSPNAGHGSPVDSDITRDDAVNAIGLARLVIYSENEFSRITTTDGN